MRSEFELLKMPADLACEFLAVFSRSEYALKVAGFCYGTNKRVDADWEKFAKEIAGTFNPSESPELSQAVTYLLSSPPQKLILENGKVIFADSPPDRKQSKCQQSLLMVRRVRNNLFHGGKFLTVPADLPDRDKLLVEHSLVVLRKCITLHYKVNESYRK